MLPSNNRSPPNALWDNKGRGSRFLSSTDIWIQSKTSIMEIGEESATDSHCSQPVLVDVLEYCFLISHYLCS